MGTLKPFQNGGGPVGLKKAARAKAAQMTQGMKNQASATQGKPMQLHPALYNLRPNEDPTANRRNPT